MIATLASSERRLNARCGTAFRTENQYRDLSEPEHECAMCGACGVRRRSAIFNAAVGARLLLAF